MAEDGTTTSPAPGPSRITDRILGFIEWAGNKLPDPAVLFLIALIITWIVSKMLASVEFTEIDPRSLTAEVAVHGAPEAPKPPADSATLKGEPVQVKDQLTSQALITLLTLMVNKFVTFAPLGVVLVALLGVGVADHTGFIRAAIRSLINVTPKALITPMVIFVAIISHSAGDTGYVLVIPLGGVIFAAAGRHPVAGIAAAFAGVSGGFSANFIPSTLDTLLQGLTQSGARIIAPTQEVNVLCNWYFMSASCVLIVLVGWWVTDRIVEPRLRNTAIDGDEADAPSMQSLTSREKVGLVVALGSILAMAIFLACAALPEDSLWRDPVKGTLDSSNAPLMQSIVALIFLFFLIPGVIYGYIAGTVKSHRDIIKGMSNAMGTMGYYLVLVFFAAMFIYAFNESNLGVLLAIKGAAFLQSLNLGKYITIVGIILLAAFVNLLIGSASAKWALLAPIFVPMLMELGFSPDLTQAAYRIGDSSTNIVTPLMPYFPLIVVYAQRYVKSTGVGTMISLMLPYSICFMLIWTILLCIFWALNIPLGVGATYTY